MGLRYWILSTLTAVSLVAVLTGCAPGDRKPQLTFELADLTLPQAASSRLPDEPDSTNTAGEVQVAPVIVEVAWKPDQLTRVRPDRDPGEFEYRVNGSTVERRRLYDKLRFLAERSLDVLGNSEVPVLLRCDARIRYDAVLWSLFSCWLARLRKIDLATSDGRVLESNFAPDSGPGTGYLQKGTTPAEVRLQADTSDPEQCAIQWGSDRQEIDGFEDLEARIRLHFDNLGKRASLPIIIYAADEVPWEQVVRARDTAMKVGVQRIIYGVGPENKGIRGEKPMILDPSAWR